MLTTREANDDDVNMGFSARFAFPCESAVGKMNLDIERLKQIDSIACRLVRLA